LQQAAAFPLNLEIFKEDYFGEEEEILHPKITSKLSYSYNYFHKKFILFYLSSYGSKKLTIILFDKSPKSWPKSFILIFFLNGNISSANISEAHGKII
jgi:hypothetical protein